MSTLSCFLVLWYRCSPAACCWRRQAASESCLLYLWCNIDLQTYNQFSIKPWDALSRWTCERLGGLLWGINGTSAAAELRQFLGWRCADCCLVQAAVLLLSELGVQQRLCGPVARAGYLLAATFFGCFKASACCCGTQAGAVCTDMVWLLRMMHLRIHILGSKSETDSCCLCQSIRCSGEVQYQLQMLLASHC